VTEKYRQHGKSVEIVGLNQASSTFRDRLSGQLGE
jgi:SulP family sulfate permease